MTIDGKTINDLYKLRVGLVSAEDAGLIHEGISDDLFLMHYIQSDRIMTGGLKYVPNESGMLQSMCKTCG